MKLYSVGGKSTKKYFIFEDSSEFRVYAIGLAHTIRATRS